VEGRKERKKPVIAEIKTKNFCFCLIPPLQFSSAVPVLQQFQLRPTEELPAKKQSALRLVS
jgi:hypothetical protein